MKLAGCGKEIVAALRREFSEKIVSALRRQLNRTTFGLLVHQRETSKIVQQFTAQITDLPLEILQTPSSKTLRLLLHPEILQR